MRLLPVLQSMLVHPGVQRPDGSAVVQGRPEGDPPAGARRLVRCGLQPVEGHGLEDPVPVGVGVGHPGTEGRSTTAEGHRGLVPDPGCQRHCLRDEGGVEPSARAPVGGVDPVGVGVEVLDGVQPAADHVPGRGDVVVLSGPDQAGDRPTEDPSPDAADLGGAREVVEVQGSQGVALHHRRDEPVPATARGRAEPPQRAVEVGVQVVRVPGQGVGCGGSDQVGVLPGGVLQWHRPGVRVAGGPAGDELVVPAGPGHELLVVVGVRDCAGHGVLSTEGRHQPGPHRDHHLHSEEGEHGLSVAPRAGEGKGSVEVPPHGGSGGKARVAWTTGCPVR